MDVRPMARRRPARILAPYHQKNAFITAQFERPGVRSGQRLVNRGQRKLCPVGETVNRVAALSAFTTAIVDELARCPPSLVPGWSAGPFAEPRGGPPLAPRGRRAQSLGLWPGRLVPWRAVAARCTL